MKNSFFTTDYKQKDHSSLMMEAERTSETSVDNHFTRQYISEDNSELQKDQHRQLHSYKSLKTSCYIIYRSASWGGK
jgi:hypothetical protein